jgi:multidrug efflux system outer membrane protein
LASSYTGGAAISWEIDLWGKLRRADEAARAELLASEANRRALVSSLISTVADLYHQIIARKRILDVSLGTAKNQRDALYLIRRLSESGIASAAEERQQEVALAVTESTIPTLRQRIVAFENGLSILLGRIPGKVGVDVDSKTSLPEFIPSGIPSRLLDRRPDLMAVEQQLVASNARVGEAKARFFPSISLTGLFGGLSTSASDFLSGGTATIASLGFNGLQPLFAGGFFIANYDAALARLDQSIIIYRKAVLTALAEVSNSLVAYEEAGNLQKVQKVRAEAARESLRLSGLRYRAGVVSFIEVLDAQRQLFSAETAVVESSLDRHLALSSVYLALGGGWEEKEDGAKGN